MFINDDIEDGFILKYCSAYIVLKNYGAFFKDLQIESIEVSYKTPSEKVLF